MGVQIMTSSVIFLLFLCRCTLARDLLTIVKNPSVNPEDIPACRSEKLLSCSLVEIDFSALTETTLTLPRDCTVTFLDSPTERSFTFHDDNDGTEATFTRAKSKEGDLKLIGNVEYWDGRDFTLEPCSAFPGCHVWMEMDVEQFVDLPTESVPVEEEEEDMRYALLNRKTADPAKIQQGKDDSTTIVTYSVMFYYTKEFAKVTDDIPLYVEQVVAETNQGYINSNIPLRVKAHCIEEADLHDVPYGSDMLSKFGCYKGGYKGDLLNSADAAALLVEEFSVCGIANFGSFMWGGPVSTSQKSCALGYYTFGHELGHNFGCLHDARQGKNWKYSYGLGKHLEGTGKRTNMAYWAPGHGTRINWYSNPDVMYQGVPTGTENENNARVLREHRFVFAAIGDESKACKPDSEAPKSGEVKSPNFPENYANDMDTSHTIVVQANKLIKIHFTDFDLESASRCQYDYVQIMDEDGTEILARSCGSTKPNDITSITNKVNVTFHSDYSIVKSGFKLTWTAVSPFAGCDGGDSCCKNGICRAGEGDCDRDSDCHGDLVCGKDNCKSGGWWGDRSSFDATDDCCMVQPPGCDGGDSCCKPGECQEGEGDCDGACDCYGHLVCGKDNCKTGFPGDRSSFEPTDDCCYMPVCTGGNSCCKNGICGAGEGDCDNDSDCNADLVCGKDNCKGFPGDRSSFEPTDDCCMVPS